MADWLTSEQAAAYLQVHPKTLYRYVRAGKLRQYNPGGKGHPRFLQEELDALLRGQGGLATEQTDSPVIAGDGGGAASDQAADAPLEGAADSQTPAGDTGTRRRSRGFGFGSGFALVPPRPAPSRGVTLRQVLEQVDDLSRRCEELRQVVATLLQQEEREGDP